MTTKVSTSMLNQTGNLNITSANVTLGPVANIHITGGTSGQVLTTDGSGNLSFATAGGGSALTIKEEGSNLTTTATSIDFVGGGVTATNTGNAVTVTVPTGTTRAQAMTMGIIFGG